MKNLIEKLKALRIYAVMCSGLGKSKKYNVDEVEILMNQLSSYLTTRELIDLHRENYMEWCRKRNWFINILLKSN